MALSERELRELSADSVVDARGISCPGPFVAAKKILGSVPSGGVMEIQSSDPGTIADLPEWLATVGHTYLGHLDEPGYFRIFLRKAS